MSQPETDRDESQDGRYSTQQINERSTINITRKRIPITLRTQQHP
jgi:hypothetical protein